MATPDFKDIEPPKPEKKTPVQGAKMGIGRIVTWLGIFLLGLAATIAGWAISAPSWSYVVPEYWTQSAIVGIIGVAMILIGYKLDN
ncbi:MAG: hypothetical protein JW779_08065 [Candidatus Thorarchaeota archaeon]|nr:hypothetical protein [Candidatus Thorarchaeota archaeon]